MDNLTHALTGALAGLALAPRGLPMPSARARAWTGAVVANLPDLDVFLVSAADPLSYLALHRGPTHSLVLLPLWALITAALLYLGWRRRQAFAGLLWLSAVALLTHVLLDALTAYGTRLLLPFDATAYAWPLLFIIDLAFTGLLLAGLVSARWGDGVVRARWTLVAALAYLTTLAGFHHQATQVARAVADGAPVRVYPQPLAPWHWKLVVADPDAWRITHVDLLAGAPAAVPAGAGLFAQVAAGYQPVGTAQWESIPHHAGDADAVAFQREVWTHPALAELRRFAALPAGVGVEVHDGLRCALFSDLRFRVAGAERDPFRYRACPTASGGLLVSRAGT